MADVASLAVALHLNAASFKSQVFDAYDSASKESKKFAQSASKDAGQTAERLLEVSANARKAGADLSASGQMARSSQLGFGQLRTALTNVSAGSNVATSSLIGGFIPALERSLENVNNVKFSLAEQQRVAQEAAREAINLSRAQIEGAQADRKSAQEKINLATKMRDEAIARREQAFSLDEYLERQVEVNKQHGISVSYAEEHAKNARVIREANLAEAEAKKRMQSASIEVISANKSEIDGKKNLTTATNQLSEASKELTFSQRAAANSASLFKSAWGMMGGAVGVGIMASAGAFTYLYSQYQQAEERQKAFNAALQKGGLGLTTTAYDLRNLANELGGTADAYKSVTAAASAGFSGDLLHQVSELGIQMEKSGGSVDLLISKLVSIGEQPLTGIKKLIDEGVIVESGIVQRIAQLEREGKAREASELAQISTLQAKTKAENTQSEALKVQKGEVESLRRSYQGLYDITNGSNYAKINTQMNNAFLEEAIRLKKEQSQVQEKQLLEQKEAAYKQLEITTNFNSAFKAGTDQQKERSERQKQFKDMLDKGTISATEYQQALKGLDKLFTTPKKTGGGAVVDEGKQRIEQLLQQGAALRAQLEETEGLTASERKLASFEQELIGLQGQHLNARQKTIQAHSSEIRAQLIKNAELEKEIKYKELRKKFDDQNFEVMQRTSKLSQDSSNQMLQMTMSQPAYELMLEEQRVRDDFRQRRYQLDKEVSDKTTQLYADQTLFLSQEEQRQLDIVRQSSRDKLAMNRNATTGMAKGIQDFGNSAENVYDQMRTISNGALSDMSGMLANFVATGKLNFADFAQSIVTEITKMIFQMMIFNALKAGFAGTAFGDAIGAGAAPTPNAKGGTYSSPGLSAYSNTIVKSPTLFPFAKGGAPKMGLMGEAGAEAIMPLTRARDGSLGVRVLGLDAQQQTPNIIIQQTFHLTGNGDQALQEAIQQAAEMGAKQGSQDALAKIQRDFQSNGTLRKSLGR